MREIKFKLWLPREKRMTHPFDITEMPDKTQVHEGVVYLQFTGLKDKNGKEVYEGDIVVGMARNPDWDCLDDNSPIEIPKNMAVHYAHRGFWLTGEGFGWEGEDMVNWENIEVIGNIYETPQLIQQ